MPWVLPSHFSTFSLVLLLLCHSIEESMENLMVLATKCIITVHFNVIMHFVASTVRFSMHAFNCQIGRFALRGRFLCRAL